MAGISSEDADRILVEDYEQVRRDLVAKIEKDEAKAAIEARIAAARAGSAEQKKAQKELDKIEKDARRAQIEEQLSLELDAAERVALKQEKEALELLDKKEEREQKIADYAKSKAFDSMKSVISAITSAANTYSSYVDRIQTRLLGANETMGSISTKLMVAFGASPIFQMKSVMEKVAQAVEKGINFNVESRAAMEVLKDKVAATFDAFDSSLLRIIKIQQADSTQARLGMESMLTEFLNKNFQDSSYLADNLNASVTAALLEAQSMYSREDALALEYSVQKWLGSMSSVGVSNELVSKIAQGVGYLASGDVSSLSSSSDVESLLVAAANRGGANYGAMLTGGVSVDDINAIFSGLRSLVAEIGKEGRNVVALNQYAKTFGMTVSDVQAMLNLSDNAMTAIASDMKSYSELTQRVIDETSIGKLLGRTGGASIGNNIYENFLWGSGRAYGSNVASYMGWQMGSLVVDLMKGIESGLDVQPFGVGTHVNLDLGELAQVVQFTAGVLPGVASMLGGLTSIGGVGWSVLGDDKEKARDVVTKGNLVSMAQAGTRQTSSSYTGDYSEGALAQSSNAIQDKAIAEHKDETYDEEKKKTEAMVDSMKEIGDNVKFIVQLLNETGIVIRGRYGYTEPADFVQNSSQPDTEGHRILGVSPV
ncbi:MAG: hypothetical protein NC218_02385 [Acetobacter sp.]|nr:hypothetical protein [Acetobacter sp.]